MIAARAWAILFVALGACGGPAPASQEPRVASPREQTPAAPTNEKPAYSHSREGSLRLAHYSTSDGLVGFVLDRTSGKARLRIDGDDRIYELEAITTSSSRTDFISHERHVSVSFMTDGSGISFSDKGRAEKPVWRDGDATPLP